jgi:hypothetical protein
MAATASINTNSVESELNWRSDLMRDQRNYEPLGYVWKIVLEAAAGAATPRSTVANTHGLALDWYGMENFKGKNWLPRIAQSKDRSTLLLLDPVKRPDGRVGLPDMPDPEWKPGPYKDSDLAWEPKRNSKGKVIPGQTPPLLKPQQAPMMDQSLYDRCRGQMKGTRYLVFGPIAQILIRPVKTDGEITFQIPEGWVLQARADLNGKQMELLVDQDNGQAFFYGGRFEIFRAGS